MFILIGLTDILKNYFYKLYDFALTYTLFLIRVYLSEISVVNIPFTLYYKFALLKGNKHFIAYTDKIK